MISGKQGFFYGWYFKCQSDRQTLAVIPAVHQTGRKRTCSIQIITETGAWAVEFPIEEFYQKGRLHFGALSPLKYKYTVSVLRQAVHYEGDGFCLLYKRFKNGQLKWLLPE